MSNLAEMLASAKARGYEEGRKEAINELLSKCEQYNYNLNSKEFAKIIREQLKERMNDNRM